MTTARTSKYPRILGALAATALAVTGLGLSNVGPAGAAPPLGPLTNIAPDASLNCTTQSSDSDWLSFFQSNASIPPARSCATLVSVEGVGLFGPPEFGDAGKVGTTPLLPVGPKRQTIVTPDQSPDGTLQVTTRVRLPGTDLVLKQRDLYAGGLTVRTRLTVKNVGATAASIVVYRTGDCFPGSDLGYAIGTRGSVGCEQATQRGTDALPGPGPIYMRWDATEGNSRFIAGSVADVRNAIATGRSLPNGCDCRTPQDVAAAMSWKLVVPAGGRTRVTHELTMSLASGRRMSDVATAVKSFGGRKYLVAAVTTKGVPVPGAAVDFRIGSVTKCAAVADATGTALCRWRGKAPSFVATYIGDTKRRPSRETFVPATPPPTLDLTAFPACAQFDRTGFALVTAGDAHHEEIGMTTQAPPCPGVIYRATADGVPIGTKNGDGRTTTFVGDQVAGFARLFVKTGFGLATPGCIHIQSIDSRTGDVVDEYPGPGDAPKVCIDEVAGQKFR